MGEPVSTNTSDWERYLTQRITNAEADTYRLVMEAAQEIRNDAIKASPVRTGALRAGWQVRNHRDNNGGGWVEVFNPVPYAAAVEYGTRPHIIEATNKRVLANTSTGEVFGTRVNHPGTRPQPMLRSARARVLPQLIKRLEDLI